MGGETFYFSHDYNARNDEKIRKLLKRHGMAGYGIYWAIVEDLYNNGNSLEADFESIAYDMRAEYDIVKSVIRDFGLFVFENGSFGSLSIERRLEERSRLSEKARQKALKRWNKAKCDAPEDIKEDATALKNDATALKNDATASKIDAGKEIKERKERKEINPEPEKSVSGGKKDFIDLVVTEFTKVFPEYEIITLAIEREMAGKLLKVFKKKHPGKNSGEMLQLLSDFFKKCRMVPDAWLRQNMSLTTMVQKYNSIQQAFKNRKPGNPLCAGGLLEGSMSFNYNDSLNK
jgi:hypothetical protein